jgi:hypothetical protein
VPHRPHQGPRVSCCGRAQVCAAFPRTALERMVPRRYGTGWCWGGEGSSLCGSDPTTPPRLCTSATGSRCKLVRCILTSSVGSHYKQRGRKHRPGLLVPSP